MKTREQAEKELECLTKRLKALSTDLNPYYGNSRNVMAYVEGAVRYLEISIENTKH